MCMCIYVCVCVWQDIVDEGREGGVVRMGSGRWAVVGRQTTSARDPIPMGCVFINRHSHTHTRAFTHISISFGPQKPHTTLHHPPPITTPHSAGHWTATRTCAGIFISLFRSLTPLQFTTACHNNNKRPP